MPTTLQALIQTAATAAEALIHLPRDVQALAVLGAAFVAGMLGGRLLAVVAQVAIIVAGVLVAARVAGVTI